MKKLRGGMAVTLGSTMAVLGFSAVSATSAFAAGTTPPPSGVHFEITSVSTPSPGVGVAGGNISVTVSVYEWSPDVVTGSGPTAQLEDAHALPASFPFTFTNTVTGTTYSETGIMPSGDTAKSIPHMIPQAGETFTYTYMVPTPAVSGKYTVSGGAGFFTDGSLNHPPFMIHWESNTTSTNQWVDNDDPIYGTASTTVTLNTPQGKMPEVPYAGALPAFFAAGAIFFYVRKRRRPGANQ